MDPRKFDGMIQKLSGALSRRSLVGGSVGAAVLAAVGLADDEAEAKKKNRGGVGAEACIPTGKKCPSKKPRGRTGKRKPKKLSCNQCCQRRVTKNANGKNICYCAETGTACTETRECCDGTCQNNVCVTPTTPCRIGGALCTVGTQCCSGICETDGRCADVCILLGNHCDSDADCCSGHCNDTGPDATDTCAPCKPTGGECNGGDSIECCSRVCNVDPITSKGTCA